ncbi:filamentous hemagglutinin [Paraburkholderia sp. XV]|uniref:two-partner secretion domain-containing protein n=1 Tax=Paraburkholderia sp. XV TaxID=2831520 RepID=UPI001CD5D4FE|nr:filamentous hemagglutinin [Paraburkholderia sp. XV]
MHGPEAGPKRYSLWMRATASVMVVVMYFAPAVFLADATAHAAPIVDPRAPIPFQPTVTQSSVGVPVINIAAPNAQGLSVSQFQTLSSGPEGLIFNNSPIAGTSLIGGQVGANPNLAGRTASTILAQVTSTGSQYASVLAGPLEIFGNTAALIIANPNGISIPGGTSLTNISNLTLTTGTPQFITAAGGSSTDFTHAGALAYSVNSGNISINGPPGSDGTPGVGIAGTVGNLDLIAQTVSLNAPLNASQRVNIITGNQLVSPTSSDATGIGYALSSNGSANTASSAGLPAGSYAIDASRFGSVTTGQVYIVGTAAGLGVNMQGSLMATTGNVVVNANGDVSVADTYANQNVGLASTGKTSISGTGLANQNYTVNAGGDISSTGSVSAGQNVSMTSGGNVIAASVASNGNSTLTASDSMTVGSVTGQTLALHALSGDLTVNSALSAPGTISAVAGRDLTINGAAQGGSTVTLTAAHNATVNGSVAAVGDVSLTGATGTATTTGNVTTNGQLDVAGQQGVNLGGTVSSQGETAITSSTGSVAVNRALTTPGQATITAGQDVTVAGDVHTGQNATVTAARDVTLNGALNVNGSGNASIVAGRDITGTGDVSVANDTTLSAGRNVAVSGAIQTGNNLSATGGQNLAIGATTAVGTETLTAATGNATLAGNALSGGDMKVSAGTDVTAQGSTQSLGNVDLNAQHGSLTANGPVSAAGDATLNAAQNLTLGGQTTVSHNATLTGTNITTQGMAIGGSLAATAANSLDTSAGQLNATFSASAPALSVNGNATLIGANVTTANAVIGGTYSASATTALTTGGTAAYKGDATLTGGTVSNVGTQMAAGNLKVSGSTVTNQGSLSSLQTMTVNAADIDNSGTIYGPTIHLAASGGTTNTGGLLATNALSLTTGSLNNSNGLVFAGDVNNPTSATGDASVTVNGGNGTFNNTNGQILAQHNLTVNLANQAVDPSAGSFGSMNAGNAFDLSVRSINNSGTWTLPGTTVNVTASQGINNAGAINQGAGTLTLNGAVTNSGTLTARDLTVNGAFANLANASVLANDAFTLNGSGSNAGTVAAVNTLTISGSSYNNSGGTTRAGGSGSASGSGNLNVNLTGDLTNVGGTLTATNDLALNANSVSNSGATSSSTTTTTTTVNNTALALGLVVGTEIIDVASWIGHGGDTTCCNVTSTTKSVSLADALSVDGGFGSGGVNPAVNGNTVTLVEIPTVTGSDRNGNPIVQNRWFVQTPDNASQSISTVTLQLPTATETTSTTGSTGGASSVIAAGHNLSLNANALNNQGGTVTAGNDASINVQSLSNGGTSYTSTVTDTVDISAINSFLSQAPKTISIWGSFHAADGTPSNDGCPNSRGTCLDPSGIALSAPGSVGTLSTSSSVTVQGSVGQIVAGNNLNLSGGNLVNAGSIVAGNNVNVSAGSFTNQGTNTPTLTTTAGCAPGFSGCNSSATSNPNSTSYSYQQTNATVTAGNDVVIAAGNVSNTYGDLVAGHNVVIGGAGTTASSATQAGSVTNTSGAIAAGNDARINAGNVTNTIAAPAQIHQNYGSGSPFAGCSQGCEAYLDVQSANPGTITANHDVSIQAGTFSNTGSLVTALNNVTVNATSSASSGNQYLNAYWHGSPAGQSTSTWGCAANPSLCATLYGAAYNSGDAQDPAGLPSAVGLSDFVPGTIQAGNTLSVNSPTLTNTGNVVGQTVALSGSSLVNGLTNPHVYTPPPTVSGQVISLGPPAVPASATTSVNGAGQVTNLNGQPVSVTGAAGVPTGVPVGVTTVGKPVVPSVQTVAGQGSSVTYLVNNPASAVTGDLSPSALLAALPASLQPSVKQFYYDPYTQAQQVEQAALVATGKSSFYSTPSATDSSSQSLISNQDTKALYGAALQYAEQHNIALGTQLSEEQLAQVNAPMLWYVEETVPEPGCTVTGNGVCPTVQALMPEVLLPRNYAVVNADGEITGTNVTLDYANSILNTGSITAQNLTVNTGTLTNEQRSTDIGVIYQLITDGLLEQTTGTVVQQGGFMSAANYDINAQAINQIGGALQKVDANGTVDNAATAQLLAGLKGELGSSFTQTTVSDNLHTEISGGMAWYDSLFIMACIVAISVMSAGAASPGIGAAAGATAGSGSAFAAAGTVGGTVVSAGTANVALSAAVGGMMSSAMSQTAFGDGSFSVAAMFEAGATAALTAGLTNGITFSNGSVGWSWASSSNSLASLAGVQTVGGLMVPQAGASTGSIGTAAIAMGATATIQASVQTLLQGGSFLTNLRNDAVSDAGAAAAFAIGNLASADGSLIPMNSPQYVLAHAILGCAEGAASGTGCESGALGSAASAALSPDFIRMIDPSGAPLDPGAMATLAAFATLVGGGAAGLAGGNYQAGATWAQNEALNNDAQHSEAAAKVGGLVGAAWTLFEAGAQFSLTSAQQLNYLITHNGAQPAYDPNNIDPTDGGSNDGTGHAYAVVTALAAVLCAAAEGLACGLYPVPVTATSGTPPGNATLSSGSSGGDGSGSNSTASNNSLPTNPSQLSHIFRDDVGHLTDTPENQQKLVNLVNNPANRLGTDQFGNQWFAQTQPNGTQLWGSVRNGVIQNGGLNTTPRSFNPVTGLSKGK